MDQMSRKQQAVKKMSKPRKEDPPQVARDGMPQLMNPTTVCPWCPLPPGLFRFISLLRPQASWIMVLTRTCLRKAYKTFLASFFYPQGLKINVYLHASAYKLENL